MLLLNRKPDATIPAVWTHSRLYFLPYNTIGMPKIKDIAPFPLATSVRGHFLASALFRSLRLCNPQFKGPTSVNGHLFASALYRSQPSGNPEEKGTPEHLNIRPQSQLPSFLPCTFPDHPVPITCFGLCSSPISNIKSWHLLPPKFSGKAP
jgi:hypothetical protein